MVALMHPDTRIQTPEDEYEDLAQFERIQRPERSAFPVRSQTSRTRGRMRSRATPAARRKARAFNGSNRRGRFRHQSHAA